MDKMAAAKMKRRVKALQKELGKLGPVMRGSVVEIGPRYKQCYFSRTKDGKTQLIYLGLNSPREERAKEYSANYKKLQAIVEEMTQLNMMLLKKNEL